MDIEKNPQESGQKTTMEPDSVNRSVDAIFSILHNSEKRELDEGKADQIVDAQKESSSEHFRKTDIDSSDIHMDGYPNVRLNLPRIECTREGAAKLLSHKSMVERILENLTREIAMIQPLAEGDFVRGSNRLTARLGMSRMPYVGTKRDRKLVNGLKDDWAHRMSAAHDQVHEIRKNAPKEILESEDLEVEMDSFLKTGIWRDHEGGVRLLRTKIQPTMVLRWMKIALPRITMSNTLPRTKIKQMKQMKQKKRIKYLKQFPG